MKAAVVLLFFSCSFSFSAHAEADLGTVRDEAEKLGKTLFENVKEWSKFDQLRQGYDSEKASITLSEKDGKSIVGRMKMDLEKVLKNKIHSVERLYKMAETLRANYTFNSELTLENTEFYDTKALTADLEIYDTFSKDVKINKSASVVHVPTDVYKGSEDILNTIEWTEGLDKQFKQNMQDEPGLLWQYIGTAKGMYRVYPGFKWQKENEEDLYDNRRRGWYIQGSSSSKDMLILLDLSGSMVGSNIAIARLAAMSLLDTLQENDFVNVVVVYKKTATMLCDDPKVKEKVKNIGNCTDQMLQATSKNKKYLKSMIPAVEANGEANVRDGFKKALAVLKKSKTLASQCIQTINFFTDGVEKGEEKNTLEVLEKDNKNKEVRVFTYMTGREKGSSESPLKKFACSNRGHFYRVETLSDVREKVLTYMNVISRPLVISGKHTESWTPIYLDKSGLGLMITVVAPVFNFTEEGSLLGVVGTDVALPQLQDTVPGYEVGANGYGFATNNNGFIVFHPLLKRGMEPRGLVLSRVEGKELEGVTRAMVDRKTGSMTETKRVVTRDTRNVSRLSENRTYHYFYTSVSGTSFSCAVAIPEESMKNVTVNQGKAKVSDLEQIKNEIVMVAPWPYCPGLESDAKNSTPVYQKSYPTAEELKKKGNKENCSALFDHLLLDANVSGEIAKNWDLDADENIVSIFAGTSGGLTRVLDRSSAPAFGRDVLKEQFYQRVAGAKDANKVVYFADKNNGTNVITASAPIIYSGSVLAAAGVQLKPEAFSDACSKFNDSDCHVIDEDAFIVYSPSKEEIGEFYGAVSGPVLQQLIDKNVFTKITFEDPQGICVVEDNDGSSAMRLLNPLTSVLAYAHWWTQTLFWFLVQMSAFSSKTNRVLASEEPKTRECVKELFFYKLNNDRAEFPDEIPCGKSCDCQQCKWALRVARVNQSNLLLVVNTRRDKCQVCSWRKVPQEEEKTGLPPFTPMSELYRKRPNMTCYASDEKEKPEDRCGGGSALSPAFLLLLLLLALYAILV